MESIWNHSNIRTARKAAGLRGTQAAEQLGISTVHLSMVENGKGKPSQKLIARNAELYRQPVVFFLASEKIKEIA